MKHYRSNSFQTRIEVNLANISSSPEDEFQLHSAYYDKNLFDCELCGHRNCVYAYEVKNLKTDKILKVGSECIHHFEGKGVDIDLAEGLMKRVMKATQNARYKLIKEMGEEEYKKLTKEEKREMVTQQYMIEQAKQMLMDMSQNKTTLSEDQVQHILDLGLEDEYTEAKEKREKRDKFQKSVEVLNSFQDYLNQLRTNWETPDESKVEEFKDAYEATSVYANSNMVDVYLREYLKQIDNRKKYDWLFNYDGKNETVENIKLSLVKYGSLTNKQEKYARSLIEKESSSNSDRLTEAFQFLFEKGHDDTFIRSLKRQYDMKGFLSEKQEKALMKNYYKKKSLH